MKSTHAVMAEFVKTSISSVLIYYYIKGIYRLCIFIWHVLVDLLSEIDNYLWLRGSLYGYKNLVAYKEVKDDIGFLFIMFELLNPYAASGWFGQYKMIQKPLKNDWNPGTWVYSFESTQRELPDEYQHDGV